MKGNNTLELNEATMVEALQLWCEHTFKHAPKVTSVKMVSNKGGYVTVFEVAIEDQPSSTVDFSTPVSSSRAP